MKIYQNLILMLAALLMCSQLVSAQESVLVLDKNIELVNKDAITGLKIDGIGRDRSNRPCARIKLHINRMSPDEIRKVQVKPIGGNAVVMKSLPSVEGNGLVVEMTALKPVRFYINHPKYGDSNPVSVNLEGNVEYRMEAWCNFLQTIVVSCPQAGASVWLDGIFMGLISEENNALSISDVMMGKHQLKVTYGADESETKIDVNEANVFFTLNLVSAASKQQYVVFQLSPSDALVILDGGALVSDAYGNASKLVKFGMHKYTVEAKDYYPSEGTFVLNASNAKNALSVPVTLKPAFGYLKLSGKAVEGARVYVDKDYKGMAPMDSIRLSSGVHTLNLVRPLYKDLEIPFAVHDGAVEHLAPQMLPDFSHVTFEVEGNAAIYINDELKGQGKWSGDLPTGTYQIRTELENHRPSIRTFEVLPGMSMKPVVLKKPEPVLGSLSVESVPVGAEIYIDGELRGRTPAFFTDVLIGKRLVKVEKEGFSSFSRTVEIKEKEQSEVHMTLQSGKKVKFYCVQKGAVLYIDGKEAGPADSVHDLSYGTHEIQVRLKGYRTYRETINITEGPDLQVNVILSRESDPVYNSREPQETSPGENSGTSVTGRPAGKPAVKPAGKPEKPGKKPLGWIFGDATRRPIGFNMAVGFDYESDYTFRDNSYGCKVLYSFGNFKNRFNLEMGCRLQFLTNLDKSLLESEDPHPDPEFGSGSDWETSGSSSLLSEENALMQCRISLVPRYNFIRKSEAKDFYAYCAAEFSCNFYATNYSNVYDANASSELRLGCGYMNFDFGLYWHYDLSPVYKNNPASYHRSRVGLSFAFYFF